MTNTKRSILFFGAAVYYKASKEVLPISQGEMSPGPVIEKPIEIEELVKQIRTELD
jgi:hypothetical protein